MTHKNMENEIFKLQKGNYVTYEGPFIKNLTVQIISVEQSSQGFRFLVESGPSVKNNPPFLISDEKHVCPIPLKNSHLTDLGFHKYNSVDEKSGREFAFFVYDSVVLTKILVMHKSPIENHYRLIKEGFDIRDFQHSDIENSTIAIRFLHILQNLLQEKGYNFDFSKLIA